MSKFFAPIATAGFVLLFAAAVPAQTQNEIQTQPQSQLQAEPQQPVSVSKVRIVRISEVRGAVQLDRSNGHNFEPAIANLPVIEKNRLKTATGIAEVEFEDNSSIRLGPDSEVQFVELGRTASGATISTVRVVRGTTFVSLVKSGSKAPVNEFKMAVGDHTIQLQPDTHLRLHVDDLHASLAVLNGSVHLDSPNQVSPNQDPPNGIDVPHKKTVSFALIGDTQPTVAGNIEANPLDAWDKQHEQFHSRAASLSAFGGSPYAYGLSDLGYYGSFADAGCGTMWRPYFTSAGWDPFSNGTWAYYSGAGYSWVSPYPWAWTPYHSGSWSFCPGSGWGWMPGGAWSGLNNITTSTTPGEPGNPIKPKGPNLPTAPRAGQASMVVISHGAIVPSGATSSGSFVFRNDSAGLGVPRGELGNLRGFSEHAGRSGQASTPVYYSGGSSTPNEARGVSTLAPVSVHRGFAPPPVSSGGFSSFGSVGGAASTRAPSTSMPVSSGPAPSTGGAHR